MGKTFCVLAQINGEPLSWFVNKLITNPLLYLKLPPSTPPSFSPFLPPSLTPSLPPSFPPSLPPSLTSSLPLCSALLYYPALRIEHINLLFLSRLTYTGTHNHKLTNKPYMVNFQYRIFADIYFQIVKVSMFTKTPVIVQHVSPRYQ